MHPAVWPIQRLAFVLGGGSTHGRLEHFPELNPELDHLSSWFASNQDWNTGMQPPNTFSKREQQIRWHLLLVALVGMMGGIIIGYCIGCVADRAPIQTPPGATSRQP